MKVCPLASGSGGNAYLIWENNTYILLDAGISCKRLVTALAYAGVRPTALSAIFVTHAHIDHIRGLAIFLKQYPMPLFGSEEALEEAVRRFPNVAEFCQPLLSSVTLGPLQVEWFPVPHDSPGTLGFSVASPQHRMALATDLGFVTQAVWEGVQGADLLVVETNHHPPWVETGPYPPALKRRVLGDYGHLSNQAGAELAANAVRTGTHTLVLGHISEHNNTPQCARETLMSHLEAMGFPPESYTMAVAAKNEPNAIFDLSMKEVGLC